MPDPVVREWISMKKLITIGLLSFAASAGMFASPAARATDLEGQLVRARAVEAAIWSMPAISIREFVKATFKDYGATWNDVLLWSRKALSNSTSAVAMIAEMLVRRLFANLPMTSARRVIIRSAIIGRGRAMLSTT